MRMIQDEQNKAHDVSQDIRHDSCMLEHVIAVATQMVCQLTIRSLARH